MATGKNQTLVSSPEPTGSRPCREARRISESQEAQRFSDQLWQRKQQSSPSLLLYRESSCDSCEGTILDDENGRLNYSSKLLSAGENFFPKPSACKRIDRITNTVTPKPGKSSEGSLLQLDTSGEGVDAGRNKTGSTLSSLYMRPATFCFSPRSCPSPNPSPVHSPSLSSSPSLPSQQNIRRSSLPASMLPFQKVITRAVLVIYKVCMFSHSIKPVLYKMLVFQH